MILGLLMDMELLYELKKGGADCAVIAESTTGDQRAVDDDITNILRPLIFPTLLEVSVRQ